MNTPNDSLPLQPPTEADMPRNRYQTYVFDSEFDADQTTEKKYRDVLGPEYKGGVPTAWQDGHAMREHSALLDFVREVASVGDMKTGEEIADSAQNLMEELKLG